MSHCMCSAVRSKPADPYRCEPVYFIVFRVYTRLYEHIQKFVYLWFRVLAENQRWSVSHLSFMLSQILHDHNGIIQVILSCVVKYCLLSCLYFNSFNEFVCSVNMKNTLKKTCPKPSYKTYTYTFNYSG